MPGPAQPTGVSLNTHGDVPPTAISLTTRGVLSQRGRLVDTCRLGFIPRSYLNGLIPSCVEDSDMSSCRASYTWYTSTDSDKQIGGTCTSEGEVIADMIGWSSPTALLQHRATGIKYEITAELVEPDSSITAYITPGMLPEGLYSVQFRATDTFDKVHTFPEDKYLTLLVIPSA